MIHHKIYTILLIIITLLIGILLGKFLNGTGTFTKTAIISGATQIINK